MALPADFNKIFGSTATGGLTPIGDVNYAKGWEFVGSNPPTKNDFSYLQNFSDLKSQWLYNNKLQRTNPFGDIKSDGTVSQALSNLGLGNLPTFGSAASKDVGTGANQIPDMSSFTSSLGATGWERLPSGKIKQWGYASTASGSATQVAVTFPIPFPLECFGVVITPQIASALSGDNLSMYFYNQTTTGFTMIVDASSSSTGSRTGYWEAIGR